MSPVNIKIVIILTVLQSYSLTLSAQDNLPGAAAISKGRETYYDASKQKIMGNYE